MSSRRASIQSTLFSFRVGGCSWSPALEGCKRSF
jgi:hypothetical protein